MLYTNSKYANVYESPNKKNVQYIPQTNLQKSTSHLFNECILCKIQYVGKSETPFNLRLNYHRKNVNNPKAISACSHFKIHGHNIMKHAKFTLIEQLTEISNISKDTIRLWLKRREYFWIIKLETLAPKGLNQELNNV